MSTTSSSAFDAGQTLPAPLIAQLPTEITDAELRPLSDAQSHVDVDSLRAQARKVRNSWTFCPTRQRSLTLTTKWKDAKRSIAEACRVLPKTSASGSNPGAILEQLVDNSSLLYQALNETQAGLPSTSELLEITADEQQRVPRIYAAAESLLHAVRYRLDIGTLVAFLDAIQEEACFENAELAALRLCLQLAVLEQIGKILGSGEKYPAGVQEDAALELLPCLRGLMALNWNDIFEALSKTDHILRQDPAGTYGRMDAESRQRYHAAVVELAARSTWSESDVAREAVRLARAPRPLADARVRERSSHVGYYLIDAGQSVIKEAIGYDAPFAEQIRGTVRRWPTFFYLSTIALATCGIFAAVLAGSAGPTPTARQFAIVLLIALIPVMECAIAVTNLLVTHLLKPERLPRLDFSTGIPEECGTLVAIPILLASEKQVREAIRDLEIRYLANRDQNLHFALVTDPPDSLQLFDEKDALAGLCSSLIEELEGKYAHRGAGSFVHLHRHRAYNPAEGIWMGWERKRGKMLDLNNLLLKRTDRFPVKAGNLSILRNIRYVITLDQDTQLPTESARKLVGALAHPLNRAVIDPVTGRVVEGYAILQPRVTVSVKAAGRSRLAAIYSGDSGFDIYTRAVSDVYQDLFGAGIYTGKGIYEVETFQEVLEHRFPCNTILSHDLIEGAHARAGFISDIELVDDYPSQVSAYSRRKHRWVRGDWQIILWLFPRVPQSFGKLVPNPLSVISRWQIMDNLRRSLSEVATFALLLYAWLFWPQQALFWTLTAVALTASPICLGFFVSLIGADRHLFTPSFWKNAIADFEGKSLILLCRLTLLCHQSLVALDAVVRAMVRMTVTHRRLLEWETAAQAELQASQTNAVEKYLRWTPAVAIVITGVIARLSPYSLWVALPFLMMWGTSKAFCDWLSVPYPKWGKQINASDQAAVRHMALRTWRFFSEFCTEEENWLIPDVVQVEPPIVVHAASTTNLGLLLNAQLAAHDLGFVTLPEFVTAAERTIGTINKLPTHQGQLYNWYDTRTLAPHSPRFISTVDNGNLVCCLWTLKGACAELKCAPLFSGVLQQGFSAHLDAIEDSLPDESRSDSIRVGIRDLRLRVDILATSDSEWFKTLPKIAMKIGTLERELFSWVPDSEAAWWAKALIAQVRNTEELVRDFAPWLSVEFSELRNLGNVWTGVPDARELTPENVPLVLANLQHQLVAKLSGQEVKEALRPLAVCFSEALSRSLSIAQKMLVRLQGLSLAADHLAHAQDFSFLYSPQKELLSIGYDAEGQRLWDSHYDILASEARSAVFVAIAKGDISQEVWFRLGRTMALVNERNAMLSWTGTMFEYLMPSLWMKLYPNSLLEQAARAAVFTQQKYATERLAPWGISECSCAEKGPDGRYGYRAFGVPELALSRLNPDDLVVSPYSAFLALLLEGPAGASNLREMQQRGWLGTYGFYEACDFTQNDAEASNTGEIVACWMAHHQGMILVAAANALEGNAMQRRFHAEPMVAATERLLQEVPRTAVETVPDAPDKLNWLKTSVPVFRSFWQTAVSAPREEPEAPPAQAHEADG
jgi:cyclic beta-1,2-glucan synthetase